MQLEREQQFRLMLEKEQRHVDLLRSQLAQSPDEKKYLELEKSERNVQKLQGLLQNHIRNQTEVINWLSINPYISYIPCEFYNCPTLVILHLNCII